MSIAFKFPQATPGFGFNTALVVPSAGGGGVTTGEPDLFWDAYLSADHPLTNVASTIALDTVETSDSNITLTGGEVTLNAAYSKVIITFAWMTFRDSGTGSDRADCDCVLQLDTGSGFVDIAGTTTTNYSRTQDFGENNAALSIVQAISSGDKIRAQARITAGATAGIDVKGQGARMTIIGWT